jgi:hypothetical protein
MFMPTLHPKSFEGVPRARQALFEDRTGTTNPALKASLEEIAQQWLRLAADLEATKPLLEEWGDPCASRLQQGGQNGRSLQNS